MLKLQLGLLMLFSKVLFSLLCLHLAFATSSSEANFRCQKIYDTAEKDIHDIKENSLTKVANEALERIQEIIKSFSPATDPKIIPNQIKRCVALGHCITVIKEELAQKKQDNNKKDIHSTPNSPDENELPEEKPQKKQKKEKVIDPEKGAINLSNTLKEIAESEANKLKSSKPTL